MTNGKIENFNVFQQVSNWHPELIEREHEAKETSILLFYVLDSMTRGIVSMIEAAYLAAQHRKLIITMNNYKRGQSINGEYITDK